MRARAPVDALCEHRLGEELTGPEAPPTVTVVSVTPEQLAATLVARRDAEQRLVRERALEVRQQLSAWALEARASGLISGAWLIGSLAWGSWGVGSDVDVVVRGLRAAHPAEVWTELQRRLGCAVDLLQLEELPATFAARVQRDGQALA